MAQPAFDPNNIILIQYFNNFIVIMRAGKTTHTFKVDGHQIKFSGDFDSGNLRNV